MIHLLLTISLMSLFCNGWYIITHNGMILDPMRKLFLTIIGGWDRADGGIEWDDTNFKTTLTARFFYKPIFGCIICMSSIAGSVVYWSVNIPTKESLICWPIACVCASFTNYLLYCVLKKLEE